MYDIRRDFLHGLGLSLYLEPPAHGHWLPDMIQLPPADRQMPAELDLSYGSDMSRAAPCLGRHLNCTNFVWAASVSDVLQLNSQKYMQPAGSAAASWQALAFNDFK